MLDAPFKQINDDQNNALTTPAEDIYNKLIEIEGEKSKVKISFIQFENMSEIVSSNEYHPKVNKEKIKLGGYCNKEYKYLGYLDENSQMVKISDIATDKFNYKLKESVLGNYKNTDNLSTFWTTPNAIDIKKLLNKSNLYLYNYAGDKHEKWEQINIKEDRPRVVSTYLNQGPPASDISLDEQLYVDENGIIRKGNPFK